MFINSQHLARRWCEQVPVEVTPFEYPIVIHRANFPNMQWRHQQLIVNSCLNIIAVGMMPINIFSSIHNRSSDINMCAIDAPHYSAKTRSSLECCLNFSPLLGGWPWDILRQHLPQGLDHVTVEVVLGGGAHSEPQSYTPERVWSGHQPHNHQHDIFKRTPFSLQSAFRY